MGRRRALGLLGLAAVAPLTGAFDWTAEEVDRAAVALQRLATPGTTRVPEFFTPHEWQTVRLLVDLVIPADARSGSATDAGVPEFMDFMMIDGSETRRNTMRQGLAWLDAESQRRFTATFIATDEAGRRAILDDIAWPDRAPEALRDGVVWFNSFRDLTGAGFFSSRMGYDDLQYTGNTYLHEWPGCPEPVLRKLGVGYDVMETRR